mgnify:CR=1 FL=1
MFTLFFNDGSPVWSYDDAKKCDHARFKRWFHVMPERGIYLPGRFGIRLEDCIYMTAEGPRWFSTPPPSLDDPFG